MENIATKKLFIRDRCIPYGTSRPCKHGFSLTELLVVIAVLGVLAALLISGVQTIIASAIRGQCAGNLRQIGVAVHLYAADNDGWLPTITHNILPPLPQPAASYPAWSGFRPWSVALMPYAGGFYVNVDLFRCGADEAWVEDSDIGWSYGWNRGVGLQPNDPNNPRTNMVDWIQPGKVAVVADTYHLPANRLNYGSFLQDNHPSTMSNTYPAGTAMRHRGHRNVLHLDGHVSQRPVPFEDTAQNHLRRNGILSN